MSTLRLQINVALVPCETILTQHSLLTEVLDIQRVEK